MFWGTRKLILPAIAVLVWLGVAAVPSSANVGACRTDPTVTLSNGYSATLWAIIQTDVSNVTGVTYQLHVPQGVTVSNVSYDANGSLEHLQVVADQKGKQYYLTTTVTTTTSKVAYTAYATRQDSTVASANATTPNSVTLHWAT